MIELLICQKNTKCNTELIKFICCILVTNNRISCKYFIKEFNECVNTVKYNN